MISLDGAVEIERHKSDENKMRVDGDETETPAPLKPKLRDHANRVGFKTSPTWSNCKRAEPFLEYFSSVKTKANCQP